MIVFFVNFLFMEGKFNGFLLYCSYVWIDIDCDWIGMFLFVFEGEFGFEKYVDYVLDVFMYFVCRNGEYIDVVGSLF